MNEKITHRELCILGANWLKKSLKCTISIHEPKGIKENPDAIGWRYSWGGASYEGSMLIECKTSRADFKKDFQKAFRINQDLGIGNWRYYMCPTDIIKVEEIPEKWGLLYVNEKRKIKIIKNPYKDSMRESKYNVINTENERYLLTRWLSKTEEPEKVMMMLRETNNKYNNLITRYEKIKEQNSKYSSMERLLGYYGNDKVNKETVKMVTDDLNRLSHVEWALQLYKETQEEKYLEMALRHVKDK